jgi:hypothetical protein
VDDTRFHRAVHLDHRGDEFVLPGANVVIHPREFSFPPLLSTLVLCSSARNSFSSDLISSFSKAFGAPPRSVGQSRFPAISIVRVVSYADRTCAAVYGPPARAAGIVIPAAPSAQWSAGVPENGSTGGLFTSSGPRGGGDGL